MVDIGTYIDKLDRRTATIVVAAKDSKNKDMADFTCDGENDNTTIQDAINTLPASGGKVLLLEGTYIVSDSITLRNYITLEGQGYGTTIKIKDGLDANIKVINGDNLRYCEVSRIHLDGNKANQTTGDMYGIYFDVTGYPNLVSKCYVENFRNDGIYIYEAEGGAVINCISKNNDGYGIVIDGADRHRVVGNFTQGNARGIFLEYAEPQVVVSGNFSYEDTIGIYGYSSHAAITGNTVSHSGQHGIYLTHITASAVTGNYIHYPSRDSEGGYDGIHLEMYTAANAPKWNVVSGNCIWDYTKYMRYGIYEGPNCDHNLIVGNRIYGFTTKGIFLSGLNSIAVNNIEG